MIVDHFKNDKPGCKVHLEDLVYHELHHIHCKKEGTSDLEFYRRLSSLKKEELPSFRMPKFEL